MTYPLFKELIQGADKNNLLTFSKSWKTTLPGIGLFFLLLFLTLFAENLIYLSQAAWLAPLLELNLSIWLPLLVLAETARRYYNDLYIICDDHILRKQGRLSLKYSVPLVKYIDIRGIRVNQSILGRIFNYGDVLVGTAAQDDSEIILAAIDSPEELAQVLEDARTYNQDAHPPQHRMSHDD